MRMTRAHTGQQRSRICSTLLRSADSTRLWIGLVSSLLFAISTALVIPSVAYAQTVSVGAGSYASVQPPGTVSPGPPFRTGTGPVPTHKFWTSKYFSQLGFSMEPQPWYVQTTATGLRGGHFPDVILGDNGQGPNTFFFQPFQSDLTIGHAGLNVSSVNVGPSSDWMVDYDYGALTLRVGRGMPFIYGLTNGAVNPTVTFAGSPTTISNANGQVLASIGGRFYGLFAPPGSNWTLSGNTYTCTLPGGSNYFSVAALPNQGAFQTYATAAFTLPTNTTVSFSYNQSTSQVSTTYTVTTQAITPGSTAFLMALYPHHYASLPGGTTNTSFTYNSPRGVMRVLNGRSFTTVDTFHGTLPFLPITSNYDAATVQGHLNTVVNEGNSFPSTDVYFLGTELNRVAQLLPIADRFNPSQRDVLVNRLKATMQFWLNANGRSTSLFYYNPTWGTLLGYPASFGSDTSLNDHHFHYGYWLQTAALIGLYDPNWIAANQWGGMIDIMRRDFGAHTRNDAMFPFMRNFDVYAGHSWASGEAPFGDGLNQESVSEAINAWAGMILFAALTGNTQMRDAAIWAYTLETRSSLYYWFNAMPVKTFPAGFNRIQIANLFDGKGDAATFFGAQPAFVHGITMLPFTGASLYLGNNPAYVQANFNEVLTLSPGLPDWPDYMEMYEAFANPTDAFNRWSGTLQVQGGESRAHQYAWIRTLQQLGRVNWAVTADWPFHAVFNNPSTGLVTHAAFNATNATITVTFSDGATLSVPPKQLVADNGVVAPPVPQAPTNLVATAVSSSQINLSWTASVTPGVTYNIFRSTTSGFTPSAANQIASGITVTSFSNTGLAASTTFFYRVTAVNSAGSSALSNQASATTPANTGLPSPWQQADVGSVTPAGSASFASGTFTVRGSGADIWNTADAFHFVYQTLNGNGEIVARVTGVQNTDAWAKAGVMIRGSLAAGSTHAFMCLTPGNGIAFQRRVATGGISSHTSGGAATAPRWVRLTRNGNTLTGFTSVNGTAWTQVGSVTIAMGTQVFAGLAVTSHANGTLNTSTFDNVSVTGAASPFSNLLYIIDGATLGTPGSLSATPGNAASTDSIPGAGGVNHDGTPTNPLVYTLSGVSATYNSQSTQFTLYADAGTNAGQAVQVRASYDFTGDGTFDRMETYRYFATNDLSGWEAYTQAQGLLSASGSFSNLTNGTVRIEVWAALGTQPIQLRTSATSANGLQSFIVVPFN